MTKEEMLKLMEEMERLAFIEMIERMDKQALGKLIEALSSKELLRFGHAIEDRPTVNLWETDGLGVIVLKDSGVWISNQTGGHGCLHPAEQGIYIPILKAERYLQKFSEFFYSGPKWQGWCTQGIDNETADFLDNFFAENFWTKYLKVDRTRLEDSHEAWVYVNIAATQKEDLFYRFGNCQGVVTWENSD